MELAYKYPFPKERVSEDYYTWLIYSASGCSFSYSDSIPSKYRIPYRIGSRSRKMIGDQHIFNMIKSIVDMRGFYMALELSCENGEISSDNRNELLIKFCLRKAELMKLDGENDLAQDFYIKANEIDSKLTNKLMASI